MFTRTQNQVFNRLMSDTVSFVSHAGSKGMAVIKTESPNTFVNDAKELGFDVRTESGLIFDCWHETGLLVQFQPRLESWTVGTIGVNSKTLSFADAM